MPHAIVYLDLPVQIAIQRQRKRAPQMYDQTDVEILERARHRYLEMATLYGFVTVDVDSQGVDATVDSIVDTLWGAGSVE